MEIALLCWEPNARNAYSNLRMVSAVAPYYRQQMRQNAQTH
jgi:hypothetical protein